MHPSHPRLSRFVRICRTGVLLVALAALGAACDRHSATEAPDSYGHGSNPYPGAKEKYSEHTIDSGAGIHQRSPHFSDTSGVKEEEGKSPSSEAVDANAGEKPAATPNPLGIGR